MPIKAVYMITLDQSILCITLTVLVSFEEMRRRPLFECWSNLFLVCERIGLKFTCVRTRFIKARESSSANSDSSVTFEYTVIGPIDISSEIAKTCFLCFVHNLKINLAPINNFSEYIALTFHRQEILQSWNM